jgi:hypothetical protein
MRWSRWICFRTRSPKLGPIFFQKRHRIKSRSRNTSLLCAIAEGQAAEAVVLRFLKPARAARQGVDGLGFHRLERKRERKPSGHHVSSVASCHFVDGIRQRPLGCAVSSAASASGPALASEIACARELRLEAVSSVLIWSAHQLPPITIIAMMAQATTAAIAHCHSLSFPDAFCCSNMIFLPSHQQFHHRRRVGAIQLSGCLNPICVVAGEPGQGSDPPARRLGRRPN